jgi:hypothetical protein
MVSNHTLGYFISRPLSLIISNYQRPILLLLFVPHPRPNNIGRAIGLWQPPTLTLPIPLLPTLPLLPDAATAVVLAAAATATAATLSLPPTHAAAATAAPDTTTDVATAASPATDVAAAIANACSKPLGPKLEIQHDKKRKRSMPTITGEEYLSREGHR